MALKDNLTVGGTIALLIGGSMFAYGLFERSQKVAEFTLVTDATGVERRVAHYVNAPKPCASSKYEVVLSKAKADGNSELVAYLQSLPTVKAVWDRRKNGVCTVRIWDDFRAAQSWKNYAHIIDSAIPVLDGIPTGENFYIDPPAGTDLTDATTNKFDAHHNMVSVSVDDVRGLANRQYLVERFRGNILPRLVRTQVPAKLWLADARGNEIPDSRGMRQTEMIPPNTEVEVLNIDDPLGIFKVLVQLTVAGATKRGWINRKDLDHIPAIASTKKATGATP